MDHNSGKNDFARSAGKPYTERAESRASAAGVPSTADTEDAAEANAANGAAGTADSTNAAGEPAMAKDSREGSASAASVAFNASAIGASVTVNETAANAADSAGAGENAANVGHAAKHAHARAAGVTRLLHQIKSHVVLVIALIAAAVTCFFVPPDREYLGYFDTDTLACLFCTLAVVSALKERRFFVFLAGKIVTAFGNMRRVAFALVFVTYFGSMIMANDMALITFLPLGWYVLSSCGHEKHTAIVFVMQNVAANLGGMLTPFGNPQNLYLYSYYSIPAGEFFATMALPFAVAFVLIAATCFFIRPVPVKLTAPPASAPPLWRMIAYFVLFALSVMIVFGVIPSWICLIVVTVSLIALEPRSFLRVDYGLLLTFCAFFVFSGNLARLPAVRAALVTLVGASPLLVGTASCQVISNVPSAVLLSRFTDNYRDLLVAVNIGGLGTPVASLASLITLGEYRHRRPGTTLRYLALFSAINFSYLAVLIGTGFLNDLILP